ncbi:amino acid/amide ABC transporter substrate-binding protein (HAAT family) [Humitalea rosea]|uniref:Amino acid/amide ABC transporter substrate-binding protein (HAAT family) n=1 Tax=Humitalea rosea TaxID=990373 RepID=A0A2W7K7U6_9PROT|nr:ABC transporter substrate-binding protein [Humitalea rosea]PZW43640.1 amino acid/amide ABC transporter substrate-binding protein (HAAT family) [Humitalea rosea]
MTLARRTLLLSTSLLAAPSLVRAQAAPIKLGTLTPLTGAGGPYGPVMAACVRGVVDQVNAAGGVLGKQIELISEDDQTNPEAGVRAARKLIDVDRVSAIMGTWASSVTTAVAPLAWENKVFLATVSGADSITLLPHNGWLVRTQPNTTLQGKKFGEFAVAQGAKRIFVMMPQTPFTQSQFAAMKAAAEAGGGAAELLIYDATKPSLRTEVDQAMRFRPDVIVAGGYTPDTSVLLRDLYRASFSGKVLAFAYAVNQAMLGAIPKEVVEGVMTLAPSPAAGSGGYAKVQALAGTQAPDPYTCQIYDHVNLVLMAMAKGGATTGQAVHDNIRKVSQGSGESVDTALDGLRAIAAGREVNYEGASGPCDFNEIGDVLDVKFRYEQVKAGALTLIRIA